MSCYSNTVEKGVNIKMEVKGENGENKSHLGLKKCKMKSLDGPWRRQVFAVYQKWELPHEILRLQEKNSALESRLNNIAYQVNEGHISKNNMPCAICQDGRGHSFGSLNKHLRMEHKITPLEYDKYDSFFRGYSALWQRTRMMINAIKDNCSEGPEYDASDGNDSERTSSQIQVELEDYGNDSEWSASQSPEHIQAILERLPTVTAANPMESKDKVMTNCEKQSQTHRISEVNDSAAFHRIEQSEEEGKEVISTKQILVKIMMKTKIVTSLQVIMLAMLVQWLGQSVSETATKAVCLVRSTVKSTVLSMSIVKRGAHMKEVLRLWATQLFNMGSNVLRMRKPRKLLTRRKPMNHFNRERQKTSDIQVKHFNQPARFRETFEVQLNIKFMLVIICILSAFLVKTKYNSAIADKLNLDQDSTTSKEGKIDSFEKAGLEATRNLVLQIDKKPKGYDESASKKLREAEQNIQKIKQNLSKTQLLNVKTFPVCKPAERENEILHIPNSAILPSLNSFVHLLSSAITFVQMQKSQTLVIQSRKLDIWNKKENISYEEFVKIVLGRHSNNFEQKKNPARIPGAVPQPMRKICKRQKKQERPTKWIQWKIDTEWESVQSIVDILWTVNKNMPDIKHRKPPDIFSVI
eukprot:GFUD01031048.1.p1 GENE.GFUD01031048.1~~GFUD01031048.1.p1  ORF type:complete len:638 (+),score=137.75 GFUD01031048.1:605-2518(+)